jgi:hypothetical protein
MRVNKFSVAVVLLLLLGAQIGLADWFPGDPYKMHFPQLPNPAGWDVCVVCQWIADDFVCSEAGPITDIHFWTSWKADDIGQVPNDKWDISIWSNNMGVPGMRLWTWNGIGTVKVRLEGQQEWQGWICPSPPPLIVPQDHHQYFQVNITDISEPFIQSSDVTYWLVIKAKILPLPSVGWKTSTSQFQNPAKWSTDGVNWFLVDTGGPVPEYHDQAFVITGREAGQKLEFGDAPEDALAYPPTGGWGWFPTCVTRGPAGWVQHTNFGAYFGPSFDLETDGNAGLCSLVGCFPPYDQDECFQDGDAGLIIPQPYTINGLGNVVKCPLSAGTALGRACQMARWGRNVDIDVHNHMPSQSVGYVNVLIDWDQSGSWGGVASCPTAGTPEHVLVNFQVPNPYDGPLSALGPPDFLIGPNNGYVWARFTITEQPVRPDWNGEGSFEDGETEDYLLRVKPTALLKWSQPPAFNPASPYPGCYWGWDEYSVYQGLRIAADDYRCSDYRPITDIHWWGSYIGYDGDTPPLPAPDAFHIAVWTDVPVGIDPFSHPGKVVWQWVVARADVYERPDGCDFHPEHMQGPDTCFRYDFVIPESEWFYQKTPDTIYWISISAIYPAGAQIQFPWGWKTREHYFNDDAVRIFNPTAPVMGSLYVGGEPIKDMAGASWDLAFELTTEDCLYVGRVFNNGLVVTQAMVDKWVYLKRPNCWCCEAQKYGNGAYAGASAQRVDTADLGDVKLSWMKSYNQVGYKPCSDFNLSGRVDTADLGIIKQHWMHTEGPCIYP